MWVGGIMQTSLSLVSLTRGDLVSFHSVFLKCAILKVILLEAYSSRTQFYHRKVVFLCIFKTVNVLVQMSVLRFHINSIMIDIQHKLFQSK